MSAVTASLCSTLMFVVFVSADQKIITVKSGEDVILPFRAPNNNKIIAVEWSRVDLEDKHVLLYRDGKFEPDNQHPSFKNRVNLQDRQMKDGDVSLILKDVTINDAGTYECGVFIKETQSLKSTSIINLSVVVPPGQTGGDTEDESFRLKVGVAVSALFLCAAVLLLLVAVGGVVVHFRIKKLRQPLLEDCYIDDLKIT
ncbi:coxsackievirus and adenovirus receptor homolog [Maylandia zebra]|uniref:coxsackievirus and adenovirus receptor homolog n=1 Tax=Maylandia zebra TaxID=106582 RepID=UPI00403C648C